MTEQSKYDKLMEDYLVLVNRVIVAENENERLRKTLEGIRDYARDCYKHKEAPMAWRIIDKSQEALKGED